MTNVGKRAPYQQIHRQLASDSPKRRSWLRQRQALRREAGVKGSLPLRMRSDGCYVLSLEWSSEAWLPAYHAAGGLKPLRDGGREEGNSAPEDSPGR